MSRSISEVRNSADLYLQEADLCANNSPVLGFAAMTMTLSCVVAIGEALFGKARAPDEKCIAAFCKMMTNNEWLLHAQGQNTNESPSQILTSVRNALFHALSLPNHVCLVPSPENFKAFERTNVRIGIVPSLFVRSVKETIDNIVKTKPRFDFDGLADSTKRSLVVVTCTGSKAGQ